jgi:hypothetical protein
VKLHPDDVLLFEEVAAAGRRVAKAYGLPLKEIVPHPDPEYATAHRGYCEVNGTIAIAMRGKENGAWALDPRLPEDVWETLAHELAHLRHFDHGKAFQDFEDELLHAVRNQTEDHREKVLRKLVKMQACRESEAKLGNSAAAEAFAAAINRMMLEYELTASDVEHTKASANDPIIEMPVNLRKHDVKLKRTRVAWQEALARVVAKSHLCTWLLRTGANQVWFVGTRSHATVAEYVYGTLVNAAERMAEKEYVSYFRACQAQGDPSLARGFKASWLDAFITRISERFEEERQAAVEEAAAHYGDVEEGTSTALARIDSALVRAREYVENKFHGRSRAKAAYLRSCRGSHAAGRARGKAAADRMVIGRRALRGGAAKALDR